MTAAAAPFFNAERVAYHGSVILRNAAARLAADNAARRNELGFTPTPQAAASTMTPQEFWEWIEGVRNQNGGPLNERTALSISAIYASVALIGGAILSMPIKFYRETKGNPREEFRPDEWWLVNEQPHAIWAASTAWDFSTQAILLQGDQFWRIHRASRYSPKITALEPMHPATAEVIRTKENRLLYRFGAQMGQVGNTEPIVLDQDDVIHVPGPGFDGLRGLSQIKHALAIPGSIASAGDRYAEAFFRNSARPDYALATDKVMTLDQIKVTRDQLLERHQGASKAFLPIVLQGGLKVQPITMTAEDAQLIEQRRFAIEDIARIFGVPPFMIGQTDKTTAWGTGLEAIGQGFKTFTLQRHLVKTQNELNRKLFRNAGRFCEFCADGLMWTDAKNRTASYRTALGRAGERPWMTVREVRLRENLSIDDESMDELEKQAAAAAPAAAPAPAPAPNEDGGDGTKPNEDGADGAKQGSEE